LSDEYHKLGKRTGKDKLQVPLAQSLVAALSKHAYARYCRALLIEGAELVEGIEFDIEPTHPQRPVSDIRSCERMCVLFTPDPLEEPKVLALRRDFPRDTSHTYLSADGTPVHLCLFEEDYAEVRASLTPERFLSRIQDWLTRAALGQLHLVGQPVEPFVSSSHLLIVDPQLFENEDPDQILALFGRSEELGKVVRLVPLPSDVDLREDEIAFLAIHLRARVWASDTINRSPTDLEDLKDLLASVSLDVVGELQNASKRLLSRENNDRLMAFRWIVLVVVPQTRKGGSSPESYSFWAFLIDKEIRELGVRLGLWEVSEGNFGAVLNGECGDLSQVQVTPVRVTSAFTRRKAWAMAGLSLPRTVRIASIGAGALGSQVMLNLARQGVGEWTIIDNDQMLPHNLSRHALFVSTEGLSKAKCVAEEITMLLSDPAAAKAVHRNVLYLDPESDDFIAFASADHIYDFSVSSAVLRHLAQLPVDAPRTSAFLMRGGQFLVALSEGLARSVRLDDLDAQLSLACWEREDLRELFLAPDEPGVRYAHGCRDITTVLPQDVVAIHSGLASHFLRTNLHNADPSIHVWELACEDLTVAHYRVCPSTVIVSKAEGWEIRVSDHALRQMRRHREAGLPNETSGVLIGMFDMGSGILRVCAALPAPPDSDQWPTACIRGIEGLHKTIKAVERQTGEALTYMGEWHSHLSGCPSTPSSDDREAHDWLRKHMGRTGHPALIAIQGDHPRPYLMLCDD